MYQNGFVNAPQVSIIGQVFAWWEEIKCHVRVIPGYKPPILLAISAFDTGDTG